MKETSEAEGLRLALEAAHRVRGATAPNPPVGACLLDESGKVISVGAHERAGLPHAEAVALERARGVIGTASAGAGAGARAHTLIVTLEPCNHQGRTPPCTEAILAAGIRRVIFGTPDPNPRVSGGGAARLLDAGLEVECAESSECRELIAPFARWSTTGLPWLAVKTAHREDGGMIPPAGHKTFTSAESLALAHDRRRRADAILTGSGTVLADDPLFTVRHVPDHAGKRRWLLVFDRRGRVPESWLSSARERGLEPLLWKGSLRAALTFLGERGCLEALVEAGPALSASTLESELWNEHVAIEAHSTRDRVVIRRPGAAQLEVR
jgi:diaminohydroxyphosphoribosylaminopyrimidine deaminase/5-amino-6-(5-phosphoribosylamino)uracil reductase